ncbi:unnamed protein product [Vicia faba]|uniref:Uncharacterized protein n=1 Tax=Vicia faba TaxID=3906 RepID=A0AAV1AGD6_VICFA|nr:unnamed protein product [Vicia faba]
MDHSSNHHFTSSMITLRLNLHFKPLATFCILGSSMTFSTAKGLFILISPKLNPTSIYYISIKLRQGSISRGSIITSSLLELTLLSSTSLRSSKGTPKYVFLLFSICNHK